jgi:hypothetical protein
MQAAASGPSESARLGSIAGLFNVRYFGLLMGVGESQKGTRGEGKLYRLPHVVLLAILASIAGANSYRSVHTSIAVHPPFGASISARKGGWPWPTRRSDGFYNASTRTVWSVCSKSMLWHWLSMRRWREANIATSPIDGKTLRGRPFRGSQGGPRSQCLRVRFGLRLAGDSGTLKACSGRLDPL